MSEQQDEPKIVVDEDWKSPRAGRKGSGQERPRLLHPRMRNRSTNPRRGRIPPASFEVLLSTLVAQALTAMGKLPDPIQGHPVVRPDLAKHYIDMLGMLEEKTKGNLTKDEAGMLDGVLHQLRVAFVMTRKEAEPKVEAGDASL